MTVNSYFHHLNLNFKPMINETTIAWALAGIAVGAGIGTIITGRELKRETKRLLQQQPGYEPPVEGDGNGRVLSDFTPDEFDTYQHEQLAGWGSFYRKLRKIINL